MLYVLIQNNMVLNGPREWSYRSFQSTLEEELGISYTLPFKKTDNTPLEIADGVRILPAMLIEQSYNAKIQHLHGPFWNFENDVATGTYQVVDNDIDAVKNTLKQRVAANRWNREVTGVKVVVQGTEVSVDTRRGDRDIFVHTLMLMSDTGTVHWKFPEGWLDLTKADLAAIVSSGVQHVEAQFVWEAARVAEIDACTTLTELDAVDLGDPLPQFT